MKVSPFFPPVFTPLLNLVENHYRFWIFPPRKWSQTALLKVLEKLDIFTKYSMTLFNFSPTVSPSWKKKI